MAPDLTYLQIEFGLGTYWEAVANKIHYFLVKIFIAHGLKTVAVSQF